jgi:hypothetical protein
MKPVLFVMCFTLGLSLMVLSGYVPQAASAHGARPDTTSAAQEFDPFGQPLTRTVTRRVLTSESIESADLSAEPGVTDQSQPVVVLAGADESPTAKTVAPLPAIKDSAPAPGPAIQLPPPAAAPQAAAPPSLSPEVERIPVVANAGPDRVIWIGWDELPLDGSASEGAELTYYWRQISGPVLVTISDNAQAVASATGLLGAQRPTWRGVTYEFELAVTDASGERAVDRVKYSVQSAPALRLKPTAERHFQSHDGYELAHFVSWITNLENDESTFEISSPTELTFTKVSGSACELTGSKSDAGYTYQVVVYGQSGEPTSWVEFLVDTEEKVPGIIQLGVSWEGR